MMLSSSENKSTYSPHSTRLSMAVTPIGPFCPFRSAAAVSLDPKMSRLNKTAPDFATDMTQIQQEMQLGQTPNPAKLLSIASSLEQALEEWEDLMTRLRISPDFQTREYAKLTQAHLEKHGQTIEGIGKMMRWQSGVMKAMARNMPPPLPPPDLDLMKLVTATRRGGAVVEENTPPSMSAMVNAQYITSTPFKGTEKAFDSPTVQREYEALCRDHDALIKMGAKYAEFDPVGKLAFLSQMDSLEERWDIFFARFSLMGMLDQQYVKECNAFLQSMNLDEASFRSLLKRAHELMREDAENERNRMFV